MREVPSSEFAKNFGRYREIAQREPIAVTSHGRATGYFVSAAEFEELQRYKSLARHSFATADLPREKAEAIAAGRMSPEHDHLNALLEGE
ncbi:type II toxin-antitoxin system Phd/YefM family antitoxin [Zavarzinia sp.]|uniref:type II toxin-antitoxin system Phd/YefM family antitoxin n=1 Tax=Zavarzinia sp. TaxID=2027920 RepID=UPI0035658937